MDKTKNRYSRYAQCMNYVEGAFPEWGIPDNYTELCTIDGLTPLAILSQDEENFVQTIWNNTWFYTPPYYIGLHQDSKGNWVWYDDNMKEFSVGNFSFEKRPFLVFLFQLGSRIPKESWKMRRRCFWR